MDSYLAEGMASHLPLSPSNTGSLSRTSKPVAVIASVLSLCPVTPTQDPTSGWWRSLGPHYCVDHPNLCTRVTQLRAAHSGTSCSIVFYLLKQELPHIDCRLAWPEVICGHLWVHPTFMCLSFPLNKQPKDDESGASFSMGAVVRIRQLNSSWHHGE